MTNQNFATKGERWIGLGLYISKNILKLIMERY